MRGNQHSGPKVTIVTHLRNARVFLKTGDVTQAQVHLARARRLITLAPTSTRRRWKCGR